MLLGPHHPAVEAGRPAQTSCGPSRRREFCHFAGTPFSSLLKNLLKVQGGCHQMTVSPAAKVESLNAGVAGAVLLFEARRQRRRLLLRGGG